MRRSLEKPSLGCLSEPECERRPIQSHLLAESWLRLLADESGHVVEFVVAVEDAGKRPVGFRPNSVGVGEALTFPGFCEQHDNALFACLESEQFTASPRQLACLAYRSVCQDVCAKHQLLRCNLQTALGPDSPDFVAEKATGQFRLLLELMNRKLRISEMLRLNKFAQRGYVVEFKNAPTFMVSTTFLPHVTFTGRELEHARLDWVTLTIFPSAKGGVAVFTWDNSSPKNGSLLLKSLKAVPAHLVTSCIFNLALEVSDRIVVSPKWWASLTEVEHRRVLARFSRSLLTDVPPPLDTIRPSSNSGLNWEPINMGYA